MEEGDCQETHRVSSVYSVDLDASHSLMFTQIDGLLVDEGVRFAFGVNRHAIPSISHLFENDLRFLEQF